MTNKIISDEAINKQIRKDAILAITDPANSRSQNDIIVDLAYNAYSDQFPQKSGNPTATQTQNLSDIVSIIDIEITDLLKKERPATQKPPPLEGDTDVTDYTGNIVDDNGEGPVVDVLPTEKALNFDDNETKILTDQNTSKTQENIVSGVKRLMTKHFNTIHGNNKNAVLLQNPDGNFSDINNFTTLATAKTIATKTLATKLNEHGIWLTKGELDEIADEIVQHAAKTSDIPKIGDNVKHMPTPYERAEDVARESVRQYFNSLDKGNLPQKEQDAAAKTLVIEAFKNNNADITTDKINTLTAVLIQEQVINKHLTHDGKLSIFPDRNVLIKSYTL